LTISGANFTCSKIPKPQKNTDGLTVFLDLLGSGGVKAVRKILAKSAPGVYRQKLDVESDFRNSDTSNGLHVNTLVAGFKLEEENSLVFTERHDQAV